MDQAPHTILRVVRRGFSQTADPLIGFALPGSESPLEPEALYEIELLPNGLALWRRIEDAPGLTPMPNGFSPNASTFDHIYRTGAAGRACFPDLIKESK